MQLKYSQKWFEERAFNALKKIGNGVWDFSDSLLLYLPESADFYESKQNTGTSYYDLVTGPEKEYLKSVAADVINELPDNFVYIDLGPGTEHKEQYFFDAALSQHKKFTYAPVDIYKKFADLAEQHASDQKIPTTPILSSFEELPDNLKNIKGPRFVSLGMTFSNYHSAQVLELLKQVSGEGGYCFINAQIRDRIAPEVLRKAYSEDVKAGAFDSKIELLGLNPEEDIEKRETTDEVRVWYTIKTPNQKLKDLGIRKGDKLLVFQSLRYTKASLEKEVAKVFAVFDTFDTGTTFIGALLKS